jgi:hypothetical protein
VNLSDEVFQHLLRHREVGDDAVLHRSDGRYVARRAAEHLLRGDANFLNHFLAVRPAFLTNRDDGRLVEHDPLAAQVDERIGGAKIDREIVVEVAAQETEHQRC